MKRFLVFFLACLVSSVTFAAQKNEIVVFSISNPGANDKHMIEQANELGQWIASNHFHLATVAADRGYFGALIQGALSKNGKVTGFRIEERNLAGLPKDRRQDVKHHNMIPKEWATKGQVNYHNVSVRERYTPGKDVKAVILFPGGIGASKAFFDVLLNNLLDPSHQVMAIVYNVDHYWDGFEKQFKTMTNDSDKTYKDISLYFANNTSDVAKYLLPPH